jgi:predicted O-methyltransferase YrrM
MFDIYKYVHPDDFFPNADPKFSEIYQSKYHIAGLLRPKSILEIGVRAGYSAAAFLSACPDATYTGLDADITAHGGVVGYMYFAEEMLKKNFPNNKITIMKHNTQQNDIPFSKKFDLIHIDGDHSEEGALKDLYNCWRLNPKYILIDDVDFIPEVKIAVYGFLKKMNYENIHIPFGRGDVIIKVSG